MPQHTPPEEWPFPETMKPDGLGYMPLYCAAQWIVSCGGSFSFDPKDETYWKPACDALLARLATEEIRVIGFEHGEPQPVPAHCFAGCRVSYPFSDTPLELILGEDLYLWSPIYLD